MEIRTDKFNEIIAKEIVQEQLANVTDAKEMYAVLVANGAEFSYEELEAILVAIGETAVKQQELSGELSEDDLDNVAGGFGSLLAALLTTPVGPVVLGVAIAGAVIACGIGAYNSYRDMKRKHG